MTDTDGFGMRKGEESKALGKKASHREWQDKNRNLYSKENWKKMGYKEVGYKK